MIIYYTGKKRFKVKGIEKILIITILLSGCATTRSIYANYDSVNYGDGVSKQEAKIIAQKELLDVKQHSSYMISFPDVEDKGTYWKVIFSSLYMNRLAYIIDINKTTGEILKSYETDDMHDVFQR